MTTQEKVQKLVEQVAALPDHAQAEVVESLLDMRAQQLGIYLLDEEDRESLARSADDIRLGRLASDDDIGKMYARFGA